MLFHEPRRRMIRLGDGEMAALDFGDAARSIDVVFAHANGFNAMTYRSILGPLSLSLRILAVDLRGHGASRLPADPQGRRSWRDFRDDLLAMLDAVSERPVVLAGHSMGGSVCLMAAAERPERVKALCLFDPVVAPPWVAAPARAPWLWRRRGMARQALRRRSVFPSAGEAFDAYRGRGGFRTWPEVMLADYVAAGFRQREDGAVELSCAPGWEASNFLAAAGDGRAALGRAKRPTKIFRAEHGSTCWLAPGDRLLRKRPELRLATVGGASHFLPMERPDIVRDALLDAAEA